MSCFYCGSRSQELRIRTKWKSPRQNTASNTEKLQPLLDNKNTVYNFWSLCHSCKDSACFSSLRLPLQNARRIYANNNKDLNFAEESLFDSLGCLKSSFICF